MRTLEKFRLGKRWWSARFEPTSFVAVPARSRSFLAGEARRKSRPACRNTGPAIEETTAPITYCRGIAGGTGAEIEIPDQLAGEMEAVFRKNRLAQRR